MMTWRFELEQPCPGCGESDWRLVYLERRRGIPLQFVACTGCHLVYQSPRLSRESLQEYFNSETFIRDGDLDAPLGYYDYAAWEGSYRATARIRLRQILRYRPDGGLLLEIGPATGVFMREAQREGFVVRGLDVASSLAMVARRRTGMPVDEGFIEETPLRPAWYDVIACFGGLSCWRDPVAALRHIRRGLRPGGIFVCNVPDADHWLPRLLGRRYPEYNHASLTIVSRQTLAGLFERAGLRELGSGTERQSATLGRIATYLRWPRAVRALRVAHAMEVPLPVWVPGVRFVVAGAC